MVLCILDIVWGIAVLNIIGELSVGSGIFLALSFLMFFTNAWSVTRFGKGLLGSFKGQSDDYRYSVRYLVLPGGIVEKGPFCKLPRWASGITGDSASTCVICLEDFRKDDMV